MAVVHISIDTSSSSGGSLSPIELGLISGAVDLFYLICLHKARGSVRISDYDIVVTKIEFSNPLDLWAMLKNVSGDTANWILDRTIFFKEEKEKREIANKKSRQELISLAFQNAEKLADVKKKLIEGGLSDEDALKFLGQLLLDQGATLRLERPDEAPTFMRVR